MSDIEAVIMKGRIFETLRGSERVNILVVGTPGTELAAFINSTEMSVTGRWPALEGWAGGGSSDAALCLSKMFSQREGLSGKVTCVGLSVDEEDEGEISTYISIVLQGRVPVGQPIAEMSKAELEERFPDVQTGMEIDMVVFVCPGDDPVPFKLMKVVKTGVDQTKTRRNIPLFLCMTKQNNDAPSDSMNKNKQEAQKALGISEKECDFIQLYRKSRTGSKVGQKDAIDKPLLKFWDKILNVEIRAGQAKSWDLKQSLPWSYMVAICIGVSLFLFALLICNIVLTFIVLSAMQGKEAQPVVCNCTMHTSDRTLVEKLQQALLTNSKQLETLNSSLKHEMQNMTSELLNTHSHSLTHGLNTLNNNFNEKLQEMKSEIQNVTLESRHTLNSTFDGMLQEMRSEIQTMTSELRNSFYGQLRELKPKVLDILNNELSDHTTNLTNVLNRTFNNFEGQINSTLNDTNTKFDDRLKKMSEDTKNLDHTFSTMTKTVDEKSSELNETWERGLLSLRNETERIALNIGTEVDKNQATFYGKLDYMFRKWGGEQKKAISVMNTTLQYWQGTFNETNDKLAQNLENTVAALNTSVGETNKDQKEQIPQESVVARIKMKCEQHSLEILVAVTISICGVIWLAPSLYRVYKRGSSQRRQQNRGRVGQAPQYDDMSDNEEWLDENHQVCIIASQDWTLDEVEGCVKTAVRERGVANTDILTLRISGQDDLDELKRTLQRETRVICCANSTTRNILLSDTEHDEISYVVKAAEKIVGGSGVMVLLYGHEKSRDIQQLYDHTSFDRTFLNKQTRLLQKAHRENLFFSVFKSLNEIQKRRLCDWIRA